MPRTALTRGRYDVPTRKYEPVIRLFSMRWFWHDPNGEPLSDPCHEIDCWIGEFRVMQIFSRIGD